MHYLFCGALFQHLRGGESRSAHRSTFDYAERDVTAVVEYIWARWMAWPEVTQQISSHKKDCCSQATTSLCGVAGSTKICFKYFTACRAAKVVCSEKKKKTDCCECACTLLDLFFLLYFTPTTRATICMSWKKKFNCTKTLFRVPLAATSCWE